MTDDFPLTGSIAEAMINCGSDDHDDRVLDQVMSDSASTRS